MTKRKETEVSGDLEPRVGPEVEATEADAKAFVDRQVLAGITIASIELVGLLREVLTHTHATARLPADLLRRIQEAVN